MPDHNWFYKDLLLTLPPLERHYYPWSFLKLKVGIQGREQGIPSFIHLASGIRYINRTPFLNDYQNLLPKSIS